MVHAAGDTGWVAWTNATDAAIAAAQADILARLTAALAATTYTPLTDARLTDARTPAAHTQTASTITDFSAAADARIALAVGGLSLVLPSSVGGGSIVGGGAVTFAGATALGLNGCFTSAFDNYRVVLDISSSTTAADLSLNLRVAGVSFAGAAYQYTYSQLGSSTPTQTYVAPGAAMIVVGRTNGAGGASVTLDVIAPMLARWTKVTGQSIDGVIGRSIFGSLQNTSTYDGLTLTPGTGALTGTVRVYGYNNG